MKLFNLPFFLTCSFVTTDARLLRGDNNIVNHSTSTSTLSTPDCDNARPNTDANQNQNQTSVKSSPRRLREPPLQEYDGMKIGDWVEIYEPEINSSYAFFAKLLGIVPQDDDGGSVKFKIKSGPHALDFVEEVDSTSVRVHEPYEFNTPAMCDYSGDKYGPAKLAQCTILSQHDTHSDTYYVLAELEGSVTVQQLPLSRIRRLVDTSPGNFRPGNTHPDATSSMDIDTDRLSGVVELYGDTSMFAEPAIVTGYEYENEESPTDFNYNLQHTTTNKHLAKVDPKFVHPYQIYEAGTAALCSIGGFRDKMNIVPCTVHSHSLKDIGFVTYQVSYYREEEKSPIMSTISFAEIKRRLNV